MFKKYLLAELLFYRKEKIPAGRFLTVNGDDLYPNSPYVLKNYRYENFPNEKLKKSGYNSFFRKGDILFLTIGAKKKVWLADRNGVCASGNNKIKIITTNSNREIILAEYLINLLTSENITKWAKANLGGSVILQIVWSEFIKKEVFIPSLEEQRKIILFRTQIEKYNSQIEKYNSQIEKYNSQIEKLTLSIAKSEQNKNPPKKDLKYLINISRGRMSASESQSNAPYRFYTASNIKQFHPETPYHPPAIVIASAWDFASQGEFLIEYTKSPFNASSWVYILKTPNGKNLVSIFCSLKNKQHSFTKYLSATSVIQRLSDKVLKNLSVSIFSPKLEAVLEKLLNFVCLNSFFTQRVNLLSQHISELNEAKINLLLHPVST